MRHMKRGRKLNRTAAHRKAMLRNMVTSLLEHGRITTTVAKAKELRGVADRMVTYGKKGSLHHRRMAARYVRSASVIQMLFSDYAERYGERDGGYTRVMRLGWRRGDAAEMAIIEMIPAGEVLQKKTRKRSTPAVAAAPVTTKETFEEPAAAADVTEEQE